MQLLRQRGTIYFRDDFRIDDGQHEFDLIFSHSVLSHAGERQMKQYFRSVSKLLAKSGVAVASLCLCSPCNEVPRIYEEDGDGPPHPTCRDSEDNEWIYPFVSWWHPRRVYALAEAMGLTVARRGDLRKVMVEKSPADGHDWVTVVRSGLDELTS